KTGFMAPGQPAEMPVARAVVPNVNRLAEATRKARGMVMHTYDQETAQTWSIWRTSFISSDWGRRMEEAFKGVASLDHLGKCFLGYSPAFPDPARGNLQLASDAFGGIDEFNSTTELEWNKLAYYACPIATLT